MKKNYSCNAQNNGLQYKKQSPQFLESIAKTTRFYIHASIIENCLSSLILFTSFYPKVNTERGNLMLFGFSIKKVIIFCCFLIR